jgi:hypothetical protein
MGAGRAPRRAGGETGAVKACPSISLPETCPRLLACPGNTRGTRAPDRSYQPTRAPNPVSETSLPKHQPAQAPACPSTSLPKHQPAQAPACPSTSLPKHCPTKCRPENPDDTRPGMDSRRECPCDLEAGGLSLWFDPLRSRDAVSAAREPLTDSACDPILAGPLAG